MYFNTITKSPRYMEFEFEVRKMKLRFFSQNLKFIDESEYELFTAKKWEQKNEALILFPKFKIL